MSPEQRAQRHASHVSSTYNAFLHRLCQASGMSPVEAEEAAVAVLCTLERRIYGEEAANLEAQLPMKLRQLLQRCERHMGKPTEKFDRAGFMSRVAQELSRGDEGVEPIVRSVFGAVRAQITEGEAEDVAHQLPHDIADLWRRPS